MGQDVIAGGAPEQGPSRLRVFYAGEADCRGLIAAEEAAKLVRMQTTTLRASVHFFLSVGWRVSSRLERCSWHTINAHGIRSMCVCVNAVQVVERVVDGQGQVMTMKRQDESGVVGCIAAKIPCIFVVECEGGGELAFVV